MTSIALPRWKYGLKAPSLCLDASAIISSNCTQSMTKVKMIPRGRPPVPIRIALVGQWAWQQQPERQHCFHQPWIPPLSGSTDGMPPPLPPDERLLIFSCFWKVTSLIDSKKATSCKGEIDCSSSDFLGQGCSSHIVRWTPLFWFCNILPEIWEYQEKLS